MSSSCATACGAWSMPAEPIHAAAVPGFDVGGKTGTAQTISNSSRQKVAEPAALSSTTTPVCRLRLKDDPHRGRRPGAAGRVRRADRRADRRGSPEDHYDKMQAPASARCARPDDSRNDVLNRRHYFAQFDWVSFLIAFGIACIGLLFIYSASRDLSQTTFLWRQLIWPRLRADPVHDMLDGRLHTLTHYVHFFYGARCLACWLCSRIRGGGARAQELVAHRNRGSAAVRVRQDYYDPGAGEVFSGTGTNSLGRN